MMKRTTQIIQLKWKIKKTIKIGKKSKIEIDKTNKSKKEKYEQEMSDFDQKRKMQERHMNQSLKNIKVR